MIADNMRTVVRSFGCPPLQLFFFFFLTISTLPFVITVARANTHADRCLLWWLGRKLSTSRRRASGVLSFGVCSADGARHKFLLRGARCAIKRKRRRAGCRRILFVLPTSQTGSGDGTPLVCLLTASVAPLFHRLLLSAAAMAVHLRDVDLVFLKKDARADVSFLYVFFFSCVGSDVYAIKSALDCS